MISLTSETRTPYHSWRAGPKLAAMCLFTLGFFFVDSAIWAALVLVFVAGLYLLGGMRFAREGLRNLRPMLWICGLIFGWHLYRGEPLPGFIAVAKLTVAVSLANLVTMTTQLAALLEVLERAMKRIGISAALRGRVALAIALVIRFIPVLGEKGGYLAQAWRARSPKRAGWRLFFPFALIAIDDAEQVADAIRARGGVTEAE
ncbi:ABC transporter permease [Litorivita pollutaquae]|uniref:ABC transporter permease n=1 Tax=Litorivita pollutaquae TaxID=2200892 RepID=A0A2V4MK53_9RHOB|nr:energy-coupling factor transporter transmembrane component T [Litorivita pollutaquae]OUS19918.1 hypothetical protein A9Q95_12940 [Rhodobacterales bacterium 59_46_T64]PYC46995.1 ABC transporter permease [Litorivita pollutaquae]